MRKLILIALACLGAVSTADAQRAPDANAESTVMALERLVRVQALSNKDLHTLNTVLSPDFVLVTLEGTPKNREESLAYFQNLASLRYVTHELMVRVHGDTAVATGLFQVTGVQHGKPFVRHGRFLDTWLNREGGWLMVASVWIPAA